MDKYIHWLEEHMIPCVYKKYVGIDCPGCGMQRAFVELLKGNFVQSLKLYPALLPIIFMFLLTAAHLWLDFRSGAKYIKWSFVFTVSIIVVSYIFKTLL